MTPNSLPPAIIKAVEESVAAFFTGSCGLAHVPGAPVPPDDPAAGIRSTISFLGDVPWSFALAFPEDGAVQIAKAFAGFDIPFDSPDMGDVVGEMVNVIAGDIGGRLGKMGIAAQMSLPTTVRGDGVAIPSDTPTARFTFSGPAGTCWFNLIGPQADLASDTAVAGPDRPGATEPPLPDWPLTKETTSAKIEQTVPAPPPSNAWAAAEAEAERELAERDAVEAALGASGGPPLLGPSAASIDRSAELVRAPGRRLLYLSLVSACGGCGGLAGVLATRFQHAPGESAHALMSHAGEPSARPKNPVPHIDILIRSGRFAEALHECLGAPKGAPGASETALALREGMCLEGTGQWWEASNAYQKAEADPHVPVSVLALLGQARCAAQEGSHVLARALTRRVLFRSGHPDCRGLGVREEVRYLRSKIDILESGGAPFHAGEPVRPPLSASACNGLDWLERAPVDPAPVPDRDVLEIYRTFEAPEALRVTVRFAPRPTIAVLRTIGAAAGWDVQASAPVLALLNAPVGPLEVDRMPLSEFLGTLTEGTGLGWVIQSDALILTLRGRRDAFR